MYVTIKHDQFKFYTTNSARLVSQYERLKNTTKLLNILVYFNFIFKGKRMRWTIADFGGRGEARSLIALNNF